MQLMIKQNNSNDVNQRKTVTKFLYKNGEKKIRKLIYVYIYINCVII